MVQYLKAKQKDSDDKGKNRTLVLVYVEDTHGGVDFLIKCLYENIYLQTSHFTNTQIIFDENLAFH